jgi:hypothetical protein
MEPKRKSSGCAAPRDDEPADDEPTDDEPTDDEPADDEPADNTGPLPPGTAKFDAD